MLREMSPVILCSADGSRWLTSRIFELMVENMREWVMVSGQFEAMCDNMITTQVPPYIFWGIHIDVSANEFFLRMVGRWFGHFEVI